MKKFEQLGRSLSKKEQKKILGGEGGCTTTYTGCNRDEGGNVTCDYTVQCSGRQPRDLCEFTCSAGDGGACDQP